MRKAATAMGAAALIGLATLGHTSDVQAEQACPKESVCIDEISFTMCRVVVTTRNGESTTEHYYWSEVRN